MASINKTHMALSILFLGLSLAFAGTARAEEAEIIGKYGIPMVLIPSGDFYMGSDEEDIKENSPYHKVYIEGFYMDKFEITNKNFSDFLNSVKPAQEVRLKWIVLRSDLDNEDRRSWWPTEIVFDNATGIYAPFESFEDYPVITVSWFAAKEYCNWAGERLPTEAEWERAARGGLLKKRYPWGNEIPTGGVIFERRWNSNTIPAPTEKIGNYYPNGYGLYDMAGNVWEWCSDWYDHDYYMTSPRRNPQGPDTGYEKVLRGGSWYNTSRYLRVGMRNSSPPANLDDAVGFRCASNIKKMRTVKQ